MTKQLIQSVEQPQLKVDLPTLNVGDTVDVSVRIIEGAKERIQVFNGVIIKNQGAGLTEMITVRRIVANEGVERTFRLHSPMVSKIQIKRHGHVRRARLYYLRDRVGKKRRLRDRRRGLEQLMADPSSPTARKTKAKGKGATQEAKPPQPADSLESANAHDEATESN